MVQDELARQSVEMVGDHAGDDVRGQHVQAFGGQLAGGAHAFETLRPVQFDLAGAVVGVEGVGHGHRIRS